MGDSDCVEGLICGTDNCPRKYGYDWGKGDDCCFKPEFYDDTNSTTCESTDGTCVFPFYYKGVKFDNCADPASYKQDGMEVGWCAFDRIYKSRRWGYCTDECLETHDGRCDATSLECRPIVSGSARKGAGYDGNCTFPFKYKNRIYHTCADPEDYAGVGWCAFDFDMKSDSGDIAHQNVLRKLTNHVKELFVMYPMNNVKMESVLQDTTKHAKELFVMLQMKNV